MKSRLADPALFMAMKNLPLAAKTTVAGFLSGIHRSVAKGAGMEFSQYRSYEPGDDLRRLDWKLFARSDRYYIRQSEIETSLSVRLIIDASASMNHEDAGFAKIEYTRYLAASLAYLALSQGDAVGLYVLQNNDLFSVPPRNDQPHFARLCFQLEQVQPSGHFTEPFQYKSLLSNRKKEMLIFITDFHQQATEISSLLQALAVNKHEMIVLHLLARNEAQPQFAGYTTLEDWETGQTLQIDTTLNTEQYNERLKAHLQQIKKEVTNRHISYELFTMDQPVHKALQQFLIIRNKLTR